MPVVRWTAILFTRFSTASYVCRLLILKENEVLISFTGVLPTACYLIHYSYMLDVQLSSAAVLTLPRTSYLNYKICSLSLSAYLTKNTVYLNTYLIMAECDLTGNHGNQGVTHSLIRSLTKLLPSAFYRIDRISITLLPN
jgi:hypothetical protein